MTDGFYSNLQCPLKDIKLQWTWKNLRNSLYGMYDGFIYVKGHQYVTAQNIILPLM